MKKEREKKVDTRTCEGETCRGRIAHPYTLSVGPGDLQEELLLVVVVFIYLTYSLVSLRPLAMSFSYV